MIAAAVPAQSMLIRDVELPARGRGRFDVRIARGHIETILPAYSNATASAVVQGRGGLLLPGLCDHHLHLFATAAARQSVRCGPPTVHDSAQLESALRAVARANPGGLRGVGFHESVCGNLDRHWLDRVVPDQPVRIQHRSGMLWILNSCALQQLDEASLSPLPAGVETDANGVLTGRFFDLDAWLGQRLPRSWPALGALSQQLAAYGVTTVTDAGVRNSAPEWRALDAAASAGQLLQRVNVMGSEALHVDLRTTSGMLSRGPLKIYLRESALPALDALIAQISDAHAAGRCIAVHCVTRVELILALAALREAGVQAGDRIEHGAVMDEDALALSASLGLCVVTQPHFIAERGDRYRKEVAPSDWPHLIRGRSLLAAGVALAAGSDAPYGDFDPWASMRAAVERRTGEGVVMSPVECLRAEQALPLYCGTARDPGAGITPLTAGLVADLCLLDVGMDELLTDLDARHVALTLRGGNVIYSLPGVIAKTEVANPSATPVPWS
ncbi:MAG: amidohydrolase family protein [Halioglobus sp.]